MNKKAKNTIIKTTLSIVGSIAASFLYDLFKSETTGTAIKTFSVWIYNKVLLQQIPVWSVICFGILIWVGLVIYKKVKGKHKFAFLDYKNDRLKNWIWTWDWKFNKQIGKYDIENLISYCPMDSTKLTKRKDGSFAQCPKCNSTWEGNYFEKVVDIKALIEKNAQDRQNIYDILG